MALGLKPLDLVLKEEYPLLKIHPTWERVYIGDIAEVQNGFAFSSKNFSHNKGMPLIRIRDIANSFTETFYNGEYSKEFVVHPGDILIGMDGDFNVARWKGDKGLLNQRVCRITLFSKHYSNKFLEICIQPYLNAINNETSSVTVKHLSSATVKEIPLPLPPLNEQYRIVSKIEELFSELENGIATLKQAQQQLKIYRQALLKSAFEGKLTEKESDTNGIPKEWRWIKLNDICNITGGVTKGKDFKGKPTIQLPYLRVANVQDGFLDLKEVKTIEVLPSDKEKYKLEYGDILYTEGGDKDKLGRGTIWKNEIENCIHQNHIFRARPVSEEVDSKYVAYFSQTKFAKDYFYKRAKQTTNLASINITVLSNLPILICPFSEQQQIVSELEKHLSICDNLEQTITKHLQASEFLRQSILKKAFEGRLISQDQDDAPASEMLRRIKAERVIYLEEQKINKKLTPNPFNYVSISNSNSLTILEVLKTSKMPLSAKEVWQQSKHRENIEAFYAELKTIENQVKEVKRGTEAFLSLANAD